RLGRGAGRVSERATVSAWRGQYMDGQTAALHELALSVEAGALVGRDPADGTERLRWPTDALRVEELDDARSAVTCAQAPDARLTTTTAGADISLAHAAASLRKRPRWQRLLAYGVGAVAAGAIIYLNLDPLARAVARRIPASYEAGLGQGLAQLLAKSYCETPAAQAALGRLSD